MDIDLEELAAMVELLKTAEFSEFRYEKGDLRIVIRRGDAVEDDAAAFAPAKETKPSAPSASPSRQATAKTDGLASAPMADERKDAAAIAEGAQTVDAPLLGTFYRRPKPGEPPFVSVGDEVEADTVVCIVEVMKLMNSVAAGARGIIAAVHANDGDLVEFGQSLFSIVPAAR